MKNFFKVSLSVSFGFLVTLYSMHPVILTIVNESGEDIRITEIGDKSCNKIMYAGEKRTFLKKALGVITFTYKNGTEVRFNISSTGLIQSFPILPGQDGRVSFNVSNESPIVNSMAVGLIDSVKMIIYAQSQALIKSHVEKSSKKIEILLEQVTSKTIKYKREDVKDKKSKRVNSALLELETLMLVQKATLVPQE